MTEQQPLFEPEPARQKLILHRRRRDVQRRAALVKMEIEALIACFKPLPSPKENDNDAKCCK
jgi:hypothetical protein